MAQTKLPAAKTKASSTTRIAIHLIS